MQKDARRFFRTEIPDATSQGTFYDFNSIMHFDSHMFSRNGRPTIIPKVTGIKLAKNRVPTGLDYLHITLLYCDGKDSHFIAYHTSMTFMPLQGCTHTYTDTTHTHTHTRTHTHIHTKKQENKPTNK